MKKQLKSAQQKNVHKKWWVISGAVIAVLLLVIGGLWVFFSNRALTSETYPLGDRLEYVGATYSGTVPFFSDSSFSASYHYATDMTPREVVAYFTKASVYDDEKLSHKEDPSIPITFSLKAPSGDVFFITYYTLGNKIIQESNLKPTEKQHVLIILDEQYRAAKTSL